MNVISGSIHHSTLTVISRIVPLQHTLRSTTFSKDTRHRLVALYVAFPSSAHVLTNFAYFVVDNFSSVRSVLNL